MAAERVQAIAALLARAEEAHAAFEATELDGVYDTEWPAWYAAWAVEHGIGALIDHDVTADELGRFLADSNADFERAAATPTVPWGEYTARRIAEEL